MNCVNNVTRATLSRFYIFKGSKMQSTFEIVDQKMHGNAKKGLDDNLPF